MLQLEDSNFLNKDVLVCITPTGCLYETKDYWSLGNETNTVSQDLSVKTTFMSSG